MIGLALSGGGAKGAFQAGAISVLATAADFGALAGVSVGAINAAYLAQAPARQINAFAIGLLGLWYGIRSTSDVIRTSLWRKLRFATGHEQSIYDASPLRDLIARHLDVEKVRTSGRALRIGVTDVVSGEYRDVSLEDQATAPDWIVASCSIPIAFPPVMLDGGAWYDGGLREIAPVRAVMANPDVERVVAILCSPPGQLARFGAEKANGLDLGMRALDVVTDETLANDLAGHTKPLCVIAPPSPLAMDTLDFSRTNIRRAIMAGKAAAKHALRRGLW